MSFLVLDTSAATTANYWDMDVQLDGLVYTFEFLWSDRESCWYMSILDQSGDYYATGLRLNINWNLLRRFQNPALPQGILFCIDTTNTDTEVSVPSDLGNGVELVYITADDALLAPARAA